MLSHFSYCPLVWMFYDRTTNHRINHVHEGALRIVYKDHRNDFGYLLEQSNSVPIHVRNLQLLMMEIFKTKSYLNPPFMKDIFQERNVNYNLKASFHLVALVARMSECTPSDRYGRLQRIRPATRRMINFGGNNNTINKTWSSQEGNCYLFYYYEGVFVEQMLSERDFGYERYILNEKRKANTIC